MLGISCTLPEIKINLNFLSNSKAVCFKLQMFLCSIAEKTTFTDKAVLDTMGYSPNTWKEKTKFAVSSMECVGS